MGSGGRKASLAAMRLGQGGQQKRQHSSLTDRPFIVHCRRAEKKTTVNCTLRQNKRNSVPQTLIERGCAKCRILQAQQGH